MYISSIAKSRSNAFIEPTSTTQWVLSSTNQYYAMSVKFKETTGAFDLVRIHSDTLLTAPL